MTGHESYFRDTLGALFCKADGEPWPCMATRQASPPRCGCTHSQWRHQSGTGYCRSRGCECARYNAVERAA